MAARLARRSDADVSTDREGEGTHDHLRDRVRAEGGRRGPPRPDRPAEGVGRPIARAPGPRAPRTQGHRSTFYGPSEERALRLTSRLRRHGGRIACGIMPHG